MNNAERITNNVNNKAGQQFAVMRYALCVMISALLISACEDPVPQDYTEEIYVEGFVIAGEPITHIRIQRTLPISQSFSTRDATISNAVVTILEDGIPVPVHFVDDSVRGGYYTCTDTLFRAKYNTTYTLKVEALGRTLTATAATQQQFDWIVPPKDTVIYPGKEHETEVYDSLDVSWQGQAGIPIYVLGIECTDTSGYGEYLTPPTSDSNSRLREDEFDSDLLIANETTRYGFAFVANTPIVWRGFKWYGNQALIVYTGDNAFREWYQMVGGGFRNSFDYRLSNMSGGLGVWAGASKIHRDFFLKKQQ